LCTTTAESIPRFAAASAEEISSSILWNSDEFGSKCMLLAFATKSE
jgi:hypothetical protein